MCILASAIGIRWKCYTILMLVVIFEAGALDVSTKVDIMYSTYFDDNMLVTCSVSSSSLEDVSKHNVYLHCPLLGEDKICYINCDNLLITDKGTPIFTDVFNSCKNPWNRPERVEYHYLLNKRNIGVTGQWYCAYKDYKSSTINIRKSQVVTTRSSTLTSVGSSSESSTVPTTISQIKVCPELSSNTTIIAGTIIAFCTSAIINVLLSILFCVSRYEAVKSQRRKKIKDTDKSITERQSLLSRFSHGHPGLNRSICSRTPSLESPSNKESFSTYLQDTSHSTSCKSPSYYIHPDCRIIQLISQNNPQDFNTEQQNILTRQTSEDQNSLNHAFVPVGQLKQFNHQRRSGQYSYSSYSPLDQVPQPMTMIPGRTCNSHQQLHNNSNDESGLGSQSICNGNSLKSTPFMSGSAKVDLIHDCDPNIMSSRIDK